MRVLRMLPVLLALRVARTDGISLAEHDRNVGGLGRSSSFHDHGDCSSRHRQPQLTPTPFCKENEAVGRNRLLASLPKAGGARFKEVLKANNEGIWPPEALNRFSTAQRAVAVNAVSWAAVVGGTLFWSRNKMSADGGVVRKALVGAVVSSSSVQVASNVLRAVSGNTDVARGEEQRTGVLRAGLNSFRWSYLAVLAVCYLGESIPSAYSAAVYQKHHGLTTENILGLHAGFLFSGMATALFGGSFLDRYGRRNGCMLWAVLNIMQCILIRSKAFSALWLGRAIAGASGALMGTAFESWMVTEHHNRGYPSHSLGDSFRMVTWVNGLTAVASGFVGHASGFVWNASGEKTGVSSFAPFNVSIAVSMVSLVLVGRFWKENFGDRSFGGFQHTREALKTVLSDGRLWMTGLVQGLFEAATFVFILFWSLVLTPEDGNLPLGMVFSTMMISLCGGSSLFKFMTEALPGRLAFSPEACLVLATGLSTVALGASSVALLPKHNPRTSFGKLLPTFLVYEACMGLYYPAMSTCRSKYIDNRLRGSVMNILRVPMYLLAAIVLSPFTYSFLPGQDPTATLFGISAGFTGMATVVQVLLLKHEKQAGIAYDGSPAMPSLPKDRRGREVPSAIQNPNGQGRIGVWSLFSLPKTEDTGAYPCSAAPKSAVVTAGMQGGALAAWMMTSTPSSLGCTENMQEWATWRCSRAAAGGGGGGGGRPAIAPFQWRAKMDFMWVHNKKTKNEDKDAWTTPPSSSKPATSSALATSKSASSSKVGRPTEACGAKSNQPQSRQSPSSDMPAAAVAERGKAARFLSTIAGGLAAAGWLLCRASAPSATSPPSPHGKSQGWPDLFGDVPPSAIIAADKQHPSWQPTAGSRIASNKDRNGVGLDSDRENKMIRPMVDGVHPEGGGNRSGGAEAKGRREIAQQGDAMGAASNCESEAGVWVGWGGGCAF